MKYSSVALSFCLLMMLAGQNELSAQLMADSFTVDAVADQQVRVTDGSPLTGAPFNVPADTVFDLSAVGSFTVDWADEAGGVADITDFSAVFSQTHPALGPYDIFATGLGPGATFSGQLSNIVSDNGNLVSADMSVSTTFSLTLQGPGVAGTTMYTQETATFAGNIFADGSGTGFTSPDDLEVFLSTGNINNDPLTAVGFNRTVTAISSVPEPSSALLVSLVGLVLLRRRK
ncbi:PEP-CTERM sorting domain-containing protein [Mariniblastus fucicola]|uniref:PEP-CTERM sorting domain-containing protein n=1 Tax=Mariniblastus fucicola TaxID=980251 RepID=UPI0012F74E37|nr:PEP-CTERM sorting domain-containing protein [Mariniblastus fucicola]